MIRRVFPALLLLLATAAAAASAAVVVPRFKSDPIPNHYIVRYHDGVDALARQGHETQVHATARLSSSGWYRGVIRTFAIGPVAEYHAELHPAQVNKLRRSGMVRLPISLFNAPVWLISFVSCR